MASVFLVKYVVGLSPEINEVSVGQWLEKLDSLSPVSMERFSGTSLAC